MVVRKRKKGSCCDVQRERESGFAWDSDVGE